MLSFGYHHCHAGIMPSQYPLEFPVKFVSPYKPASQNTYEVIDTIVSQILSHINECDDPIITNILMQIDRLKQVLIVLVLISGLIINNEIVN